MAIIWELTFGKGQIKGAAFGAAGGYVLGKAMPYIGKAGEFAVSKSKTLQKITSYIGSKASALGDKIASSKAVQELQQFKTKFTVENPSGPKNEPQISVENPSGTSVQTTANGEAFNYENVKSQGTRYIYDPRLNKPGGRDVYRDTQTGRAVRAKDIDWPEQDYVEGTRFFEELDIGTKIKRVGHPDGEFGSFGDTTISQRGLPPGSEFRDSHIFEVIDDGVTGHTSIAAEVPQFDAKGGAKQFQSDETFEDLLKQKKIRNTNGDN